MHLANIITGEDEESILLPNHESYIAPAIQYSPPQDHIQLSEILSEWLESEPRIPLEEVFLRKGIRRQAGSIYRQNGKIIFVPHTPSLRQSQELELLR